MSRSKAWPGALTRDQAHDAARRLRPSTSRTTIRGSGAFDQDVGLEAVEAGDLTEVESAAELATINRFSSLSRLSST